MRTMILTLLLATASPALAQSAPIKAAHARIAADYDQTIAEVIRADYPDMREGVDFVNLGFQAGNEGVMKVVLTDFKKAFINGLVTYAFR